MYYNYPIRGYTTNDYFIGMNGLPGSQNKIVRAPQSTSNNQKLPGVDPTLFNEAAISFRNLLKEASLVLNRLAESKEFASEVMDAAQKSNTDKVKKLIESTGIHSKVDVTYNPDGIKLGMSSQVEGSDCCHLQMALRWR